MIALLYLSTEEAAAAAEGGGRASAYKASEKAHVVWDLVPT